MDDSGKLEREVHCDKNGRFGSETLHVTTPTKIRTFSRAENCVQQTTITQQRSVNERDHPHALLCGTRLPLPESSDIVSPLASRYVPFTPPSTERTAMQGVCTAIDPGRFLAEPMPEKLRAEPHPKALPWLCSSTRMQSLTHRHCGERGQVLPA